MRRMSLDLPSGRRASLTFSPEVRAGAGGAGRAVGGGSVRPREEGLARAGDGGSARAGDGRAGGEGGTSPPGRPFDLSMGGRTASGGPGGEGGRAWRVGSGGMWQDEPGDAESGHFHF